MLEKFKFCKVREVKNPNRGTDEAAGIDFYVPTNLKKSVMDEKCKTTSCWPLVNYNLFGDMDFITLKSGQSVLIPSGIHLRLDKGYCLKFENKSGVAAKKHILVGSNTVDSDYCGEIHINLHNVSNHDVIINAGEKIIQGLIYKIELPKFEEYENIELLYKDSESERGQNGFGSTGTK